MRIVVGGAAYYSLIEGADGWTDAGRLCDRCGRYSELGGVTLVRAL